MGKALGVACAVIASGCGHVRTADRASPCWSMTTTDALGACVARVEAENAPVAQRRLSFDERPLSYDEQIAVMPCMPARGVYEGWKDAFGTRSPPRGSDYEKAANEYEACRTKALAPLEKQRQAQIELREREKKEKAAEQARMEAGERERLAEFQRLQHDNAERAAAEAAQRAADKASAEKRARLARRAKKTTVASATMSQSADPPLEAPPANETPEARRARERRRAEKGVALFRAAIWSGGERARMAFLAVELNPRVHTVLQVTVNDAWLTMPQALRKKLTTDLWQLWVRCVGDVDNADHWRISVVDTNGEEHAGSRLLGGSLIWAED